MDTKKKKTKSLRNTIMLLTGLLVVLTALAIGLNGVLSIKAMSETAYNTYVAAVNSGYNAGTGERRCEGNYPHNALPGRCQRILLD